ncbi:MAG: hypothetical protein H0X14_06025 [Acidobacteria bacterium]|nr:hypothetical protein [Acidobacteriota bacterium]
MVVVASPAVVVSALAADIAILIALVAANFTPLFARDPAVRTVAASLSANLALAFTYVTSLVARDLAGADAAADALTVLTVVMVSAAVATLRERLGRACQKQDGDAKKKKPFHCSTLSSKSDFVY